MASRFITKSASIKTVSDFMLLYSSIRSGDEPGFAGDRINNAEALCWFMATKFPERAAVIANTMLSMSDEALIKISVNTHPLRARASANMILNDIKLDTA